MLYYKNNKWHICIEKVKYTRNGEKLENFVGQEGKDWWLDFEKLHKDMEIIEFIGIIPTNKQTERLEEVNLLNIGDGYSLVLSDFVMYNKFSDKADHILKDLENKKNKEEQEPYIMDLDFRISMVELGM